MFKITEYTEVHLATFTKREESHGDEKVAAVTVGIELTGANTLLDAIDPAIRHSLYKAVDDQDQLPGVEPATPVLRCNSFEKHTLTAAHEGWTLAVDDGIDDTKPMKFGGCKVDRLQVEAKQGGSIVLRFRVGTSDLDAERLGKLGMLHGHSMWITLTPPEPKAEAIDGTTGHPGASGPDAGELFAQEHGGPEDESSEGGDPDSGDYGPEPDQDLNPLREPAATSTRTARGREATKRALAEGMAAAQAAGVE